MANYKVVEIFFEVARLNPILLIDNKHLFCTYFIGQRVYIFDCNKSQNTVTETFEIIGLLNGQVFNNLR